MTSAPNRIAKIRKMRGLSQQQLAEKLGVHWITVSKLERGKQKLTVEWMDKLAAALDVGRWAVMTDTAKPLTTIEISGHLLKNGMVTQVPPDGFRKRDFYRWTLENPDSMWLEVGGDGIYPLFKPGDLLQFAANNIEPKHYIGRLCYIQDTDKQGYVGVLANGSTPDLFDIQLMGERPIRDVCVTSVHQIIIAIFDVPDAVLGIDEDFYKMFESKYSDKR